MRDEILAAAERILIETDDQAALSIRAIAVSSRKIRRLRILSFSFNGWRSTIRLPSVLPIRTIAPVDIMFKIILVAVPALQSRRS